MTEPGPSARDRPARALAERARAWGVDLGYEDYRGERRHSPTEAIERVLETLSGDRSRPPDASVVVTRADEPLALRSPGDFIEIRLEDGGSETVPSVAAPATLPPGYHSLVGRDGSEVSLIVSPGTCFLPEDLRAWGWAVQLYSARSRSSWGIGDLSDLDRLASWATAQGAGALLLNPLHAAAPGLPQQASPYYPSSRCFRNLIYVSIEDVPGATRAFDDVSELAARARALNGRARIDRDTVYALKLEALDKIWRNAPADRELDRYVVEEGDLLSDHATYCALAESLGGGPRSWPRELSRPGSPALERWRADNADRIAFHSWIQWVLDRQLARAGAHAGLVNDVAVGVDPQGADAWIWQDVFASGVAVGAPPDEFNTQGQVWGLPPFDPWKLRAAGYEPFIRTIRAAMRHGAGIRIDHVMGLFRLFWIPDGMAPSEGVYVRYPARELLDIVALESHRAGACVIGEDLGTVEPAVPQEMRARNMLSYRLMWFEEDPPESYPELALAAVTSHDLPTIAGLWSGRDLREQVDLGLQPNVGSTEATRRRLANELGVSDDAPVDEVIEGAYRLLATAPSALVMATLEDAVAMERRPNMPGTSLERANWALALPVTLEELEAEPRARAIANALSSRARPRRASRAGSARRLRGPARNGPAPAGEGSR